jgi:hypothetical protein
MTYSEKIHLVDVQIGLKQIFDALANSAISISETGCIGIPRLFLEFFMISK